MPASRATARRAPRKAPSASAKIDPFVPPSDLPDGIEVDSEADRPPRIAPPRPSAKRDPGAAGLDNLAHMSANVVANFLILATWRFGKRAVIQPQEASAITASAGRLMFRNVPALAKLTPNTLDIVTVVVTILHWLTRIAVVTLFSLPEPTPNEPNMLRQAQAARQAQANQPAPMADMPPGPDMALDARTEAPEGFDLDAYSEIAHAGARGPVDPLGALQRQNGATPPPGAINTMAYAQMVGPHDLGQGALS